jgi:hypothetical protein
MKHLAIAFTVCFLLASPAWAKEIEGVQLPETAQVEGTSLSLSGAGLRTRLFIKAYVLGLYTSSPKKDAAAAMSADEIKRLHMTMLRDADKKQLSGVLQDAVAKNVDAKGMEAIKARLDTFFGMFTDLKKGESVMFTYMPGKGLAVQTPAGEKGVVPGKDFADAIFSIWLGQQPVDDDLKKKLVGG